MKNQTRVKSVVWVSRQFEGLHHWPEAPSETAFLRDLHRHLFKVCIRVNVAHGDRAVEFFRLIRFVDLAIMKLQEQLVAKPAMSCEHMAEFLFEELKDRFSLASTEVSEDGENGATLYFS